MGANWRSVIPALAKAVVLHKEGGRMPKVCVGIFLVFELLPGFAQCRISLPLDAPACCKR